MGELFPPKEFLPPENDRGATVAGWIAKNLVPRAQKSPQENFMDLYGLPLTAGKKANDERFTQWLNLLTPTPELPQDGIPAQEAPAERKIVQKINNAPVLHLTVNGEKEDPEQLLAVLMSRVEQMINDRQAKMNSAFYDDVTVA